MKSHHSSHHSALVPGICCACSSVCTLRGLYGKFQTQTCTFFLNLKVCRLKSVVTSISLNPCVSTNLKKYKTIFSRQSALKMFSTETPFEVQESSAYSPPLSPSSQCFKVVIRCDSLSNLSEGFIPSMLQCSVIWVAFCWQYNRESIMSTQICERFSRQKMLLDSLMI